MATVNRTLHTSQEIRVQINNDHFAYIFADQTYKIRNHQGTWIPYSPQHWQRNIIQNQLKYSLEQDARRERKQAFLAINPFYKNCKTRHNHAQRASYICI